MDVLWARRRVLESAPSFFQNVMRTGTRQHDETDCGAACIVSIARHYGKLIPLTAAREASGTTSSGTTIKGVTDALKEFGFESRAYRSDDRDTAALRNVPLPAILHVINDKGSLHFVVLCRCGRKKATVMDPATGSMKKTGYGKLGEAWTGYLVTARASGLKVNPDTGRRGSSLLDYARLLPGKEYLSMILSASAYIVAGICTSMFLQHIIDDVIPGGSREALLKVTAFMLLMFFFTLAAGFSRMTFALKVNVRMDSSLTLGYLERLFRLPGSFFSRRGAGELHSRLRDTAMIRAFLAEGILTFTASTLIIIFSFALMFTYHWRLAMLMLTFIPVYLALYTVASRVNRRMNRKIMESSAAFEEKVVEGISSVRLIKHFADEGTVFNAMARCYCELAGNLYKGGRYVGIFSSVADAVSKMMTAVLLTAGGMFIFRGSLTVGELVSFYSLSAYFSAPLSQLVELNDKLSEARISAERLSDVIDLQTEDECCQGHAHIEGNGDIVFDDVSFSYAGSPTLFEGLNLVIPQGKITAVQGESGCGKSTIASLLMRDCKVSSGKILLGSADISQYDLGEWRRFVSIIPQDPEMMNCSILDNICCMERSPDIRRIGTLIDELGLHDFIAGLPMGILSPIGERGCMLSGGQKQRIALARALYRDPSVLIMDEATSSLDDASQQYILDKVRSLRDEGKTIIMITHKADNVRMADQTIRL